MLFTEVVFAPFLLLTLIALCTCRRSARGQLWVLLVASYVFYGWWDVRFLVLIVFSSVLDFTLGRAIAASDDLRRRRRLLLVSLVGNLGLLGYFKYANFFLDSLLLLLRQLGLQAHVPTLEIVLPVGISFYTFQSLSYTLDIYRRQLEPTRSLLAFLVFVSAFPQLVAGPIVRARELLPQLQGRFFERSDSAGWLYVFYGLIKKLFLADPLGAHVVDPLFARPFQYGGADALFGIYAYSFQIFLDFSAYSDIAIGLGLLLGLQLPVNFRQPFAARSPVEFWRRWHITLSTWFRDYVYIPLGGNRVSERRLAGNLMIVMLVAGLWHGAAWTFVVWGALHGLWLSLYRLVSPRLPARDPGPWQPLVAPLQVFVTFNLVSLAFVFFRAPNLLLAGAMLTRPFADAKTGLVTGAALATFAAAVACHAWLEPRLEGASRAFGRLPWAVQGLALYGMFALLPLADRQGVTDRLFIYFQF